MSLGIDVSKKVGENILASILPILKDAIRKCTDDRIVKKISSLESKVLNDSSVKTGTGVAIVGLPSVGNDFVVETRVKDDCDFYIQIPDKYKDSLLAHKFCSNKSLSRCLYDTLIQFIKGNYRDLDSEVLVNNEINEVCKQFLEDLNEGKQRSNNMMYGIHSLFKHNDRYGIELFNTDYFTYNIICSIYRKLYSIDPEPLKVREIDDIRKIAPFMSCCGTGGFVSLDYKGVSSYIIGKRSSSVACPNMWHLSFDETFDPRDKPTDSIGGQHPTLKACFMRGLLEELKLNISNHSYDVNKSVICVVQTDKRLELGFFLDISVKIDSKSKFKRIVDSISFAPDINNEYEEMRLIPKESMPTFYDKIIALNESCTEEAPLIYKTFEVIDNKKNAYLNFLVWLHLWAKR